MIESITVPEIIKGVFGISLKPTHVRNILSEYRIEILLEYYGQHIHIDGFVEDDEKEDAMFSVVGIRVKRRGYVETIYYHAHTSQDDQQLGCLVDDLKALLDDA